MKAGRKFIIGGGIILGAVAMLMTQGVKQFGQYSMKPSELVQKVSRDPSFYDTGVKMEAKVVPGSVKRDAANQRPLENVQVTIDGTQLGAMTNASGNYRITGIPVPGGTAEVVVRVRAIDRGIERLSVVQRQALATGRVVQADHQPRDARPGIGGNGQRQLGGEVAAGLPLAGRVGQVDLGVALPIGAEHHRGTRSGSGK